MERLVILTVIAIAMVTSCTAQSLSVEPTPPALRNTDSQASGTGIHIAGDWRIVVSDPDGTVVGDHVFENDLVEFGARTLANFVEGNWVPGLWTVQLLGGACLDDSGSASTCYVTEPDDNRSEGNVFRSLMTAIDDDNVVQLLGMFSAQQDATISEVWTQLGSCAQGSISPDECASPNLSEVPFTLKLLDSPIMVEAAQVVTVEVKLSFN